MSLGELDGDGLLDIITGAGLMGNSQVHAYSGKSNTGSQPMSSFRAFADNQNSAAIQVLGRDTDGDGLAEILAALGPDARSRSGWQRGKFCRGYSRFCAYLQVRV